MQMLTDASALVAVYNRHDQHHSQAMQTTQNIGAVAVIATLPCFAEASLQLDGRNPGHANTRSHQGGNAAKPK